MRLCVCIISTLFKKNIQIAAATVTVTPGTAIAIASAIATATNTIGSITVMTLFNNFNNDL